MKRLRKTIVVKRCLSVSGGLQCDLKKGHGGDFHGAGDVRNGGRCEWGVVRRPTKKPPTPIMDDCETCNGTGTVQQDCENCGVGLTDKNWKVEYETYACTTCVEKEREYDEQEARCGCSHAGQA